VPCEDRDRMTSHIDGYK